MMNEPLIRVENLYKKFARSFGHQRRYGLRYLLHNLAGREGPMEQLFSGEFWALNGINLEVRRGETVGLLGVNGSGKSTLLKVISGLYLPSRGSCTIAGKVDSLIELGTGFHPHLSGRQNIAIKCAFNGFSRAETARVFDSIVDFAELQADIDRPVRFYSSGMYARLGFASAVFSNPDVLLIDEILSVGDFRFKQKCHSKMMDMKRDCATIFVSHSLNSMKQFCDRGVVLANGKIAFTGPIDEAIERYTKMYEAEAAKKETAKKSTDNRKIAPAKVASADAKAWHKSVVGEVYSNAARIRDVNCTWTSDAGTPRTTFERGETIHLDVSFTLPQSVSKLYVGIPIWNDKGEMVCSFSSELALGYLQRSANEIVCAGLSIENHLNAGKYTAAVAIHDGLEYLHRSVLDPLTVNGYNPRVFGSVTMPHTWRIT